MTTTRRLLLLSVCADAGHGRAAQAIDAAVRSRGGIEVTHLVLPLVPACISQGLRRGLDLVERHPKPVGRLCQRNDRTLADAGEHKLRARSNASARAAAPARELQVVAIAGRSAPLLARCEEWAHEHPGRLIALGFARTIERVMSASDLCITQAGGLSTSECLALGLPMLLILPIPGRACANARARSAARRRRRRC